VTQASQDMTSRVARLELLVQADPGNARIRRDLAEALAGARAYDRLLVLADRELAETPEDAAALFDRATALIGLRRFEAAIEALLPLAAAHSGDSVIRFNLALAYYASGRYADARPLLEANHCEGGRSADQLRLLLSTYHHLGLIDEGVAIADETTGAENLALRSHGPLAGVLALLYLDAAKPVQSARWARAALAANPQSIDGLVVEGTLRAARFDVALARERFSQVLSLAPDNGRAWIGLGTLALLAQDFASAKEQLRRGLSAIPAHVGSWHALAWAEMLSGNLAESHRLLLHALELDRNFAETHGGLAAIAALQGRTEEAERSITVAEKLNPDCLSAKFARSVLLRRSGDPEASRRAILDTLATLSPKDGGEVAKIIDGLTQRQ
jgi:tetratricopeptide (TPR) repeat protein